MNPNESIEVSEIINCPRLYQVTMRIYHHEWHLRLETSIITNNSNLNRFTMRPQVHTHQITLALVVAPIVINRITTQSRKMWPEWLTILWLDQMSTHYLSITQPTWPMTSLNSITHLIIEVQNHLDRNPKQTKPDAVVEHLVRIIRWDNISVAFRCHVFVLLGLRHITCKARTNKVTSVCFFSLFIVQHKFDQTCLLSFNASLTLFKNEFC